MNALKLIGADSSNGLKILKNLKKVERELKCSLKIDKIPVKDKVKYNISIVPTLILDEKIILSGNVLNEKELIRIIKPMLIIA